MKSYLIIEVGKHEKFKIPLIDIVKLIFPKYSISELKRRGIRASLKELNEN